MEERLTPYSVGRSIFEPGTRPYIFYLDLRREVLGAVGILEQIARIFARRGVSVMQLKASILERIRVIIIADLRGKEQLAEEIAAQLREVDYVMDAWYDPPIADGTAVDKYSFPLTFMEERAVIFRRPVYEGLIAGGWERFGSGYGQLLYIAGFDAGRKAYKRYQRMIRDRATQIEYATALFQMLGFGRLYIVRLDDEEMEAVVRVYDSFECELFRGAGEIRGNFIRGLIAGWLAARWGVEELEKITAREEKCMAKGDPYCQFRIWAQR
ncbi:MAG: 4-vinyl reductase [Thermoproteales archaeon]|nr:4-vinyl reductase [Thermoproteales archaeon]